MLVCKLLIMKDGVLNAINLYWCFYIFIVYCKRSDVCRRENMGFVLGGRGDLRARQDGMNV